MIMANLFQAARDWLPAQMQVAAVSGNTLTLTYGAEVITLTNIAWEGRTVFVSNDVGSVRVTFGDRDYLVPADEIVFGGSQIEPKLGMQFRETIDSVVKVFEVMDTGNGEPAWRHSDTAQTLWRIHTRRVK